MTWEYTAEYNKLLDVLDQDTRPWRPIALIPEDGTKVYIKCGLSTSGVTLYDVGQYEDYTKRGWWYDGDLKGEFDTEFGNCMELHGWKLVEEQTL